MVNICIANPINLKKKWLKQGRIKGGRSFEHSPLEFLADSNKQIFDAF